MLQEFTTVWQDEDTTKWGSKVRQTAQVGGSSLYLREEGHAMHIDFISLNQNEVLISASHEEDYHNNEIVFVMPKEAFIRGLKESGII